VGHDLKIVFTGAREIGAEVLAHLRGKGRDVRGVVTIRSESFVAEAARGIPVFAPRDLTDPAFLKDLKALEPDLIVVVSLPRILPRAVFEIPRHGAINFHGALLPRYRGRAPVNWAIIHGETAAGLTVHRVTEKVDAGAILLQRSVPIGPDDTAGQVLERLRPLYPVLLDDALEAIGSGRAAWREQDESQATIFGKRGPEDGAIDWTRGARELHNWVRALAPPFPGAFTALKGRRLFIWSSRPLDQDAGAPPGTVVAAGQVAAGKGILQVLDCRFEGETAASPLPLGVRLGS
jgi:methionyl-tRNA formyltransferase